MQLIESFSSCEPRVLFVGYGETDNWAHQGRYDLVLHSAHAFDQFVEELWHTLQGRPTYKDQTTFIITTDHGRGSGLTNGRSTVWKKKARKMSGSRSSARTPRRSGNAAHTAEVHQAQIAATLAALLGRDYRQAVPAAAAPLAEVIGPRRVRRLLRPDRRRRAPLAAVKAAPDFLKPQGGACRAPR